MGLQGFAYLVLSTRRNMPIAMPSRLSSLEGAAESLCRIIRKAQNTVLLKFTSGSVKKFPSYRFKCFFELRTCWTPALRFHSAQEARCVERWWPSGALLVE